MGIQALVTIGTDEVWAPPRMCGFALAKDMTIVNTNRVWWDIYAEDVVTRWAMRWPQGWVALPLESVKVGPLDTPAILPAGALIVVVNPPGKTLGPDLPTVVRFPEITKGEQ